MPRLLLVREFGIAIFSKRPNFVMSGILVVDRRATHFGADML